MAGQRRKYTVRTDSWLNVREEPDLKAKRIGRLLDGETVTVDPKAEAPLGWFRLKDGGYVMGEYLE